MTRLPLLLVAVLLLAGCATPAGTLPDAAAPKKIVLAIQPTDNAAAIMDKATEMEQFLEARMKEDGVEADVQIIVPMSNVGVIEALNFEHADAAMMGSWPAAIAAKRAGAQVVLAEQREVILGSEPKVAPYYFSYYVVMKDSPYQTLEDLRGKRVAYASPTSGSGYVFPLAKLVQDGLVPAAADGKEADAKAFFGEVRFAGGYAQAWEALRSGQVDVAVTAGDINAKLYNEVLDGTRVVAEQGPVPSHTVVFARDFVGTPEAEALKNAMMDLKGERKELMRKLVSGIFVEFQPTTTEDHVAGFASALNATGIKLSEKLG
ncbi:MAG TPA: phosphate/phosphite/phosphonate ABC transporter substrate-binding protein [Candidatus Thermoplasmatota archaeon]|nr:phosphate/phosphite/phosphonate ABC transporter substrate-binding protein [Candidatus Thermoplasmatota archaeon]